MKKIITLTLLAVAALNGYGQWKNLIEASPSGPTTSSKFMPDGLFTSIAVSKSPFIGMPDYSNQPQSIWIYTGIKLMTRIEPKPNITKIDSLIIYVKKSQLRWINDSTAVINKSN